MAAPTVTLDKPFYLRGDLVTATVMYDPLTFHLTAVAPNGEAVTVPVVFHVVLTADVTLVLIRVSDDGHTAVFTGTY